MDIHIVLHCIYAWDGWSIGWRDGSYGGWREGGPYLYICIIYIMYAHGIWDGWTYMTWEMVYTHRDTRAHPR